VEACHDACTPPLIILCIDDILINDFSGNK